MIKTRNTISILLDAVDLANPPTGLGVYAWELASALATRPDLHVATAFPSGHPTGTRPYPPPSKHRQLWRQLVLPRRLAEDGFDIYHGTEFAAPAVCTVPSVATVHDLAFVKYRRAYARRARLHFSALLRTGLRSDRIIAPTKSVADDLVRLISFPRERIRVIPEAPPSAAGPTTQLMSKGRRDLDRQPSPYLLCVGFSNPRKRVVDVVRALVHAPEFHLVVVGVGVEDMGSSLAKEANRLGVSERVRFAGFVDAVTLRHFYEAAAALVFPSFDEGFGLPPLEAMTHGTPVIAADIPPLRETLGDAAMYVPTRSPEEVAQAAETVLVDSERREWSDRGRTRAAHFSWDRTAAETEEVYRELL